MRPKSVSPVPPADSRTLFDVQSLGEIYNLFRKAREKTEEHAAALGEEPIIPLKDPAFLANELPYRFMEEWLLTHYCPGYKGDMESATTELNKALQEIGGLDAQQSADQIHLFEQELTAAIQALPPANKPAKPIDIDAIAKGVHELLAEEKKTGFVLGLPGFKIVKFKKLEKTYHIPPEEVRAMVKAMTKAALLNTIPGLDAKHVIDRMRDDVDEQLCGHGVEFNPARMSAADSLADGYTGIMQDTAQRYIQSTLGLSPTIGNGRA